MNGASHFVEALWTEDFCSASGFEVVTKRMKDSSTICKNIITFLKSRAKVESEYASSLQKVLRATDFNLEIGTLGESLEMVKQSTQRIIDQHQEASKVMSERADILQTFNERQKTDRNKEERALKNIALKKNTFYRDCQAAKRSYHQAASDAEKAEEETAKAKPMMNQMQTKDWEKIINKSLKARKDCTIADENYKKSLSVLEDTRHQWEKDLERFFNYCERQELDKINTVQNELWCHYNITSDTCVQDDENCEQIRMALEQVNPVQDVKTFIQDYFIGSQRPAELKYEPYISANQTSSQSTIDSSNQSANSSQPRHNMKAVLPFANNNPSQISSSASKTLPVASKDQKKSKPQSNTEYSYADIEPYSTCTKIPGGAISTQKSATAPISGSRGDLREVGLNTRGGNSPNLGRGKGGENGSASGAQSSNQPPGEVHYAAVNKPPKNKSPPDTLGSKSGQTAAGGAADTVSGGGGGQGKFTFSANSPALKATPRKNGPAMLFKAKSRDNVEASSYTAKTNL